MQSFINWATDQGVISKAATVQLTDYAGYGMFATEDIHSAPSLTEKQENFIVFIPEKLIITAYTFYREHPLLTEDLVNEKQALRLFLIYSRYFGDRKQKQAAGNCDWKPYIDILPDMDYFKENHVLFNASITKGTNLEQSVRSKLVWLYKELEQLQEQQGTADATAWIADITFDMYLWADCVVWSRVVGIGEAKREHSISSNNLALIPFFDFANHSFSDCNIRWQWVEDHSDSIPEHGIQLVPYNDSDTVIKKGEELFLNYGQKPNQELLFLYGFCVNDNPAPPKYILPVSSFLDVGEPDSMIKMQWLKQLNVKPLLTFTLDLSLRWDEGSEIDMQFLGLSDESVSLMYLFAGDGDIGDLNFSLPEHKSNVNDEYSAANSHKVLALNIGHVRIESLKQLRNCIEQQQRLHLPILQLRTVIRLIDALEYQQSILQKAINEDDEQKKASPNLLQQMKIYQIEEQDLLTTILSRLYHFRELLSAEQIVIEYINSMQS